MHFGYSIINGKPHKSSSGTFSGFNPATGETLEPPFHYASFDDLNRAAELAEEAFVHCGNVPGKHKARFLGHMANALEAIAGELVARAQQETGLPEVRLKGELAHTTGQLRMFASVVEEGSWVNARIDPANPGRRPLPRADIRSILRPLGPIAASRAPSATRTSRSRRFQSARHQPPQHFAHD